MTGKIQKGHKVFFNLALQKTKIQNRSEYNTLKINQKKPAFIFFLQKNNVYLYKHVVSVFTKLLPSIPSSDARLWSFLTEAPGLALL